MAANELDDKLVNVGGLGTLKLMIENLDGNTPYSTDMFFERDKNGNVTFTIKVVKTTGRQYITQAIIPENVLLAVLETIGVNIA